VYDIRKHKSAQFRVGQWAAEVKKDDMDIVNSWKIFDPPLHKCKMSKVSPEVKNCPHTVNVS
jgi:hypothetical protein